MLGWLIPRLLETTINSISSAAASAARSGKIRSSFFFYETVPSPTRPTGNGWYDTLAFDALAPAGSIAASISNFPGNGVIKGIISQACATAGLTKELTA